MQRPPSIQYYSHCMKTVHKHGIDVSLVHYPRHQPAIHHHSFASLKIHPPFCFTKSSEHLFTLLLCLLFCLVFFCPKLVPPHFVFLVKLTLIWNHLVGLQKNKRKTGHFQIGHHRPGFHLRRRKTSCLGLGPQDPRRRSRRWLLFEAWQNLA